MAQNLDPAWALHSHSSSIASQTFRPDTCDQQSSPWDDFLLYETASLNRESGGINAFMQNAALLPTNLSATHDYQTQHTPRVLQGSDYSSSELSSPRQDAEDAVRKIAKRKVQNREAQRKCRERRKANIAGLGERLRQAIAENAKLQLRIAELEKKCEDLREEGQSYLEYMLEQWTQNQYPSSMPAFALDTSTHTADLATLNATASLHTGQ